MAEKDIFCLWKKYYFLKTRCFLKFKTTEKFYFLKQIIFLK